VGGKGVPLVVGNALNERRDGHHIPDEKGGPKPPPRLRRSPNLALRPKRKKRSPCGPKAACGQLPRLDRTFGFQPPGRAQCPTA
jgi:hypothetical protein